MIPNSGAIHRETWLRQAAGLRRRINFAWWLDCLSAPLLIASLVTAAVILILRREVEGFDPWLTTLPVAAGALLLSLACLLAARRRFQSTADALVRLETTMGLHNALSAADAGISAWPAPPPAFRSGLQWHWPRLLIPPVGSLALLAGGLWLPLPNEPTVATRPPEAPQAWAKLEQQLDLLAKEQVIDEASLDASRVKLDALKSQDAAEWFSHPSLEATDALVEAQESEIRRLAADVERAARALDALAPPASALDELARAELAEDFQQALEGLGNGAFKAHPGLLENMRKIDPARLGQSPPETLQELRDQLDQHGECLGQCLGDPAPGEPGDEGNAPNALAGINRGPGHAERLLGEAREPAADGNLEGLQAHDLATPQAGDLIELETTEHQLDTRPTSPLAAGRTQSQGQGGGPIWREAPDPAEQRTLKRFFK